MIKGDESNRCAGNKLRTDHTVSPLILNESNERENKTRPRLFRTGRSLYERENWISLISENWQKTMRPHLSQRVKWAKIWRLCTECKSHGLPGGGKTNQIEEYSTSTSSRLILNLFPQSDTVGLLPTKTLKRYEPGKTGNAHSRTDCRLSSREGTVK